MPVRISFYVRSGKKFLVGILALITLSSCSRQKTITPEELNSTLTQAVSLASESEMFIDYVLQNRATTNYARTHMEYLLEEASKTAKELHAAAPEPATQQSLSQGQKQLDSLAESLGYARQELDSPDKLETAKQQLAKIEKALEETRGSL